MKLCNITYPVGVDQSSVTTKRPVTCRPSSEQPSATFNSTRTTPTHPRPANPPTHRQSASNHHNVCLVESRRSHVRSAAPQLAPRTPLTITYSYNRYISVASRVVRRSLKEDKRIAAERRGESELRFAKWEVSLQRMNAQDPGQWGLTMCRTASRAKSRS